jgi:hypothetical protein
LNNAHRVACTVTKVEVTDGIGSSPAACVFQPSLEFAMFDNNDRQAFFLEVPGHPALRVHLDKWGVGEGHVPWASGLVLGEPSDPHEDSKRSLPTQPEARPDAAPRPTKRGPKG